MRNNKQIDLYMCVKMKDIAEGKTRECFAEKKGGTVGCEHFLEEYSQKSEE